jgi:hypothetical protein
MESAPNGIDVLVWGGRHVVPEIMEADGDWWRSEQGRGSGSIPTHWQPLPTPPVPGEGEGE